MKGITFNDHYGQTDAVLAGRKTMTRRIIDPTMARDQSELDGLLLLYGDGYIEIDFDGDDKFRVDCNDGKDYIITSRFSINENVAVKQCYYDLCKANVNCRCPADCAMIPSIVIPCKGYTESAGWSNKMLVKNDLMPYQIRITGIKLEHLQDISNEDCVKEGIREGKCGNDQAGWMRAYYYNREPFCTPRGAFAALTDKINGKGTWETNPWVFAYEFELVNRKSIFQNNKQNEKENQV